MEMLRLHAPSSHALMTRYLGLPEDVKLGGITFHFGKADMFGLASGTEEPVMAQSLATIVHESDHALTSCLGFHMGQPKGLSPTAKRYGLLAIDGSETLVTLSPVFPSRDIIPAMGPELRATSRFSPYIQSPDPSQSTQMDGIYGLLDEFNAYSWSTRTNLELIRNYWPTVAAGLDLSAINTILSRSDDNYHAYLEFRYFILKYLIQAKTVRAEVYAGIMGNKSFAQAFRTIDKAYAACAAEELKASIDLVTALPREVFNTAPWPEGGWHLRMQAGSSTDHSSGIIISFRNDRIWHHAVIEAELARAEYQSMLKNLGLP